MAEKEEINDIIFMNLYNSLLINSILVLI